MPRDFGSCGYEAMLGTTKSSGKFMSTYLSQQNWIDHHTTLLFFEQTYLNIPFNTFYLIRASFQFAHGGSIIPKLRITQVTDTTNSTSVNLSYVIFIAYLVVQLYQVVRLIKRAKFNIKLLIKMAMFSMDFAFVFLSIR